MATRHVHVREIAVVHLLEAQSARRNVRNVGGVAVRSREFRTLVTFFRVISLSWACCPFNAETKFNHVPNHSRGAGATSRGASVAYTGAADIHAPTTRWTTTFPIESL